MMDAREVPAFESGGGGLLSTAGDYIRFLRFMRNRRDAGGTRLVSRKTIEWMTSDHLGAIPIEGDLLLPGYGFGLGFAVRTHSGGAAAGFGRPVLLERHRRHFVLRRSGGGPVRDAADAGT